MQNTKAQPLSAEIQQQLCVIDQSQWYILVILGAIVLSYYSVSIQRKQLICTAQDPSVRTCLPDTLPIQAVSSILVIVALIFFFNISNSTRRASKTPAECHRNQLNHLSSTLVLVAALVRFGLLTTADG